MVEQQTWRTLVWHDRDRPTEHLAELWKADSKPGGALPSRNSEERSARLRRLSRQPLPRSLAKLDPVSYRYTGGSKQ